MHIVIKETTESNSGCSFTLITGRIAPGCTRTPIAFWDAHTILTNSCLHCEPTFGYCIVLNRIIHRTTAYRSAHSAVPFSVLERTIQRTSYHSAICSLPFSVLHRSVKCRYCIAPTVLGTAPNHTETFRSGGLAADILPAPLSMCKPVIFPLPTIQPITCLLAHFHRQKNAVYYRSSWISAAHKTRTTTFNIDSNPGQGAPRRSLPKLHVLKRTGSMLGRPNLL